MEHLFVTFLLDIENLLMHNPVNVSDYKFCIKFTVGPVSPWCYTSHFWSTVAEPFDAAGVCVRGCGLSDLPLF